ncbi:MAG: multifunctional oxoglutarate decarboxylase/oxoglutarate dehydrogenase thiamine pyrophosphate-binding subunit/dihydrolipoyllysine-residue succinyltransferase subunit, partial [Candidatus Nanopelagicales bacterium]
FTPKSMLRLKAAASPIESFTDNQVRAVIDDRRLTDRSKVRRILLCSGKITWDLIGKREAGAEAGEFEHDEVAVIRLERLYPLPENELKSILAEYPADAELVWVQEEPENQGAWSYLLLNLYPKLKTDLRAITRAPSASTATGSHKFHELEQAQVVEAAFSNL